MFMKGNMKYWHICMTKIVAPTSYGTIVTYEQSNCKRVFSFAKKKLQRVGCLSYSSHVNSCMEYILSYLCISACCYLIVLFFSWLSLTNNVNSVACFGHTSSSSFFFSSLLHLTKYGMNPSHAGKIENTQTNMSTTRAATRVGSF
jgi:hypothetical protein